MTVFSLDIELFKLGDRSAFNDVYQYYSRSLQYFALSYVHNKTVAEEVVSDSMMKLWTNRKSIKTTGQIKAFLYIATKNACIDSIRAHRMLREETLPENLDGLKVEMPEVYNNILYTELLQQIEAAIVKLPLSQQLVFRMSFLENKTTEEISSVTGMTKASIFSQKSKAVNTLRKLLKNNILIILWLGNHAS